MRKVMKIMIRAGVALLILPAILCLLLFLAWFGGRVHDHRIRCEVFAYVLDNRQSIDLTDSGMYQEFFYSASGMQDVECILYPGARHELINERNKEEVFQDVLEWLEFHI